MIFLLIFLPKFDKYVISYISKLEYDWNKKRYFSIANFPNLKTILFHIFPIWNIRNFKKNHFMFSKILPHNPIPVRGGGGESAPFGGFSCAAHLLNDLRSPNLVTFPKYYRLTLFSSGRAGGFSCAAHLLIDLRSPTLVTFPNF